MTRTVKPSTMNDELAGNPITKQLISTRRRCQGAQLIVINLSQRRIGAIRLVCGLQKGVCHKVGRCGSMIVNRRSPNGYTSRFCVTKCQSN